MNAFTQQMNLHTHLPVHISIWSGDFELRTHPELSIKMWYDGIKNQALVPQIIKKSNGIYIRNQSTSALFADSVAIKIIIYVPEETSLRVLQLSGKLTLSGSYQQLHLVLGTASLYCNMENLFIRETSRLHLLSGNILLDNDDRSDIRQYNGNRHVVEYRLSTNLFLRFTTYLGVIHRKSIVTPGSFCAG